MPAISTWMLTWRLGKGKVGIKSPLSTKCTRTILFFILLVEYHISYSRVLKSILFPNGPPKIQVSLCKFLFLTIFHYSKSKEGSWQKIISFKYFKLIKITNKYRKYINNYLSNYLPNFFSLYLYHIFLSFSVSKTYLSI